MPCFRIQGRLSCLRAGYYALETRKKQYVQSAKAGILHESTSFYYKKKLPVLCRHFFLIFKILLLILSSLTKQPLFYEKSTSKPFSFFQ